ncbi:copper chaperone PCu(A)C [Acuticoccus sp. M5D2P5]|nr:copper chaperone PCu(A)C [Acuticoccus kalidii]
MLRIPHGCDGQPTNAVTVTMPDGFVDVKPMPKAGWTLTTASGEDAEGGVAPGHPAGSVTGITWSGGDLPDAHYDEFVFRGRITDVSPGDTLAFKVVQTCPDGEAAWTEIAAPGADPHDLAHPAPLLRIAGAAESAGHGHGAGHGASAPAEHAAGDLTIGTPWMRQPPPGADVAGGYMTITNDGTADDRLLAASVPFASTVEVHEMAVNDGTMTMRAVDGGLMIPAGAAVELAPGGYHIMMMGLTEAPRAGDTVPITLEFENAGTITVDLAVAPMGANKPTGGHAHH